MSKATTNYGFSTHLALPFDQAVEKVTAALKAEGFGVLTQIDVKATFKQKLDADFRPYVILGACNPPLAHKALTADLDVGLLLPCNVIVYSDDPTGGSDSGCEVAAVDPLSLLGMVEQAALEAVAQEANARLQRVIEGLKS